jgi:hypothetical protein
MRRVTCGRRTPSADMPGGSTEKLTAISGSSAKVLVASARAFLNGSAGLSFELLISGSGKSRGCGHHKGAALAIVPLGDSIGTIEKGPAVTETYGLSVKTKGAMGDGGADDSAAIQSALDAGEPRVVIPGFTVWPRACASIPTRIFGCIPGRN